MEVYILDRFLRRVDVIDRFQSLIWTERWREAGDFELIMFSSAVNRQRFQAGVMLAMNNSHRVMVVEAVENTVDSEGRDILKVSGPSLETVLDDRVITVMSGVPPFPKLTLTGVPAAVAREIFQRVCVDLQFSPGDAIPYYTAGTFLAPTNIPEPTEVITLEIEVDTVYNLIKELCETYNLGFRLIRNYDESQIMFHVYTGIDRTSNQTIYPAVIFSPNLDNLQDITHYTTTGDAKNVAIVTSKNGRAIVYAPGVTASISGFDRKVMYVKADGIDDALTGTALTNALVQKGNEALAKNRGVVAFDGEVPQYKSYIYGYDYELGDLVEMQNTDGGINQMRVTEQIFVSDPEGERSYPTLATELYIEPGTWLAWDNSMTWSQADFPWIDA